MYYSVPYTRHFKYNTVPQTNQALEEVLALVKQSVQTNRDDELFYDYLYSNAPTKEEKDIIDTIRTNKVKQNHMFRRIYQDFKSKQFMTHSYTRFQEPFSYLDGIKKAFFLELTDMERLRAILKRMTNQYYRDMVFEVFNNQLIHTNMYTYILAKNKSKDAIFKREKNNVNPSKPPINNKELKEFTLDELASYNGLNGKPAYVAVNGIVYDVSLEKTWGGASHFGLEAGKDLSTQYNSCHGAPQLLNKLPKVGTLKVDND